MIAILKREWKSYFQNITGWLFIAAVLALYGLYFLAYNLRAGYPYVSYTLSAISFIMLIAVPILTMRSMAEERHSRTDQLVLTAPVSLGKMIFGKFLAMVGVFTVAVAVIAVTPLVLAAFGTVPMGENYVAVLGFWLYGCTCIAVGMLASALTESQVIAAVVAFAFLFLGYMMNSITGLIGDHLITKVLGAYDLYTPLQSFMSGCLDLTGVVYFVSVTALCLFLTCQCVQKRRWSMTTKKLTTGMFSVAMIVVGFAVAVAVNMVVKEMPSSWTAVDATSTKLYSLTDTTKDYVKNLSQDVTIYVLSSEKSADSTLAETLQRYEDLSKHLKVVYKDPAKSPNFYQQYTDSAPSQNSMIVVSDARSRVVDYSDIYEYSYDYSTYSSSVDGYDAEGQLTSALQYVTKADSELPVIYEITGHGENTLSGGFSEAVEKANMTVSQLTLLTEDAIPDDAAAIIINGPTSDFSEDDAAKVKDYLQGGGRALIACNFEYQDLPNFASVLEAYGIERVAGIVMENSASACYRSTPYYLLPEIESTAYTSSVTGAYVFAPYSEGLSYPEEAEDITYTPLLVTSDQAVSKTDMANAETSELEDGDIAGPFTIALTAEQDVDDDNTMKLVVFGSTEMLTDNADSIVSGRNVSMFSDTLGQLAGDDGESTGVIPVKEYTLGTITVTSLGTLIGGLAATVILPILLIVTGVVIWAVRRKK